MLVPSPSQDEVEEEKEIYLAELKDENQPKKRKRRGDDKEELKGDFLVNRAEKTIPDSYEGHSDESITYSKECCCADSPRPQKAAAAPCVTTSLRKEEEIIQPTLQISSI